MTDDTRAKGSGASSATPWVLVLAAVAGVGVGAGASAAVRGAGAGESPATARGARARVDASQRARPAAEVPGAVADAPSAVVAAPEPVVAEAEAARVVEETEPEAAAVVVPPLDGLQPAIDPALSDQALDAVFAKRKADRQLAKDVYQAYGAGRFARAAGPTDLGEGIIARVATLREHAIDAAHYDLAAIEDEVGRLARGEADDNGARLDALLFEALLDLVIDFRFLHKAGPFVLRDRKDVFERERKDLLAFIGMMLAAPNGAMAMALLDPPHPQYRPMLAVLAAYREMAEATRQPDAETVGCPKLATGWRFREGSHGKEVKKLQERLRCERYYAGEIDGKYEGATVEAVKAYQEHHDLPAEGNVLEDTIKSMNVPLTQRVMQIELALQRMREARFEWMGDYFIRVNLPSFRLKVYERGKVIKEHKVIVGTNRLDDDKVKLVQGHINRTKLFGTRLYEVIVNPTWILPKRVEEGELQTSLDKDSDYLAKQNIKKVKLNSGTEVFVQGAGAGNVLGKVKFLLQESNAIYLHDTDKRHLFKKWRRDFSHGCMRVHEAVEFAEWLLLRDGWSQEEIDRSLAQKSLQRGFDLKQPVNLVTEYITVDLHEDGGPIFYDDIYDYDEDYWKGELPPRETTRWGNTILRPRWVPVMDAATVEEWRQAGKPAPRNLGPDGKPKPGAKPAPASDVDEGP